MTNMKMRTHLALILTAVTMLNLALASEQKKDSKPWKPDALVYAELSKAPRKAMARRNPLETDPDAVSAGANLFDQHCSECHGEFAEGSHKGPSLREDPIRQATPGTLFWLLTNGVVRRGMPVWSKLPEPQRWQLVSYLKSLASLGKPHALTRLRLSSHLRHQTHVRQ